MSTLLLAESDVAALADDVPALAAALRAGYVAYSTSGAARARRVPAVLPAPGSAMVMLPGLLPGVPAYSVKVHAKYPTERPAIRGVLLLHDLATGALLAVMASSHLTAVRTGLAAALASDALARPDAREVAVIGAGLQGGFQLRYLSRLRALGGVRVHDVDPARADALCRALAPELGLSMRALPLAAALDGAEIVLAATWARAPFIGPDAVAPGTHVTTLGSDEPGKLELSPDLLRAATVVVDDRALVMEMGAVGNAGLPATAIAAELGEVLAGRHPGRRDEREITVFASVGLPFQDLAVAWVVYGRATALGAGEVFEFGR